MQGIPVDTIVVGSHVWVGDPELVWVDGQVVNINGEDAEILTSNGNLVLKFLSFSLFLSFIFIKCLLSAQLFETDYSKPFTVTPIL